MSETKPKRVKRKPVEVGDVFYPRPMVWNPRCTHRRVVGIVGQKICYSSGADKNYFCEQRSLFEYGLRDGETGV